MSVPVPIWVSKRPSDGGNERQGVRHLVLICPTLPSCGVCVCVTVALRFHVHPARGQFCLRTVVGLFSTTVEESVRLHEGTRSKIIEQQVTVPRRASCKITELDRFHEHMNPFEGSIGAFTARGFIVNHIWRCSVVQFKLCLGRGG